MVRAGCGCGAGPYVSPQVARELYLLRRYLGVGAHEAQHVLPAWEVRVLLAELGRDLKADERAG